MVRHKISTLAAGLLGLAALGLFGTGLDASQAERWGVVVAANAFVAHGGGTTAPVAVGASIVAGDRITTKSGGALVLTRGQDLVTMAENSAITITDPQPMNGTLIQQSAGDVQYHVTKGPAPHFEVDTPLLATVVKGTTFRVSSGAGGSSVAVSEGRVTARDRRSGSSSSVGAGERGSVDTGHGGVSVGATASAGAAATSATATSADSGASSSTDASDDSGGEEKGKDKNSNGSAHENGNSGGGSSGSGSSGGGSSSGGSSGSGSSGSGSSDGGSSGNGGGNGKGNNGNGKGNGGGNGSNGHGHGKD